MVKLVVYHLVHLSKYRVVKVIVVVLNQMVQYSAGGVIIGVKPKHLKDINLHKYLLVFGIIHAVLR